MSAEFTNQGMLQTAAPYARDVTPIMRLARSTQLPSRLQSQPGASRRASNGEGPMASRSTGPDRLSAFVRAFPREPLCAKCLAARLATDVSALRKIIRPLRDQPGYTVESRRCKACGRQATTLTYDGAVRPPRCRICGEAIGSDTDLVFPREGGVVHGACFIETTGEGAPQR